MSTLALILLLLSTSSSAQEFAMRALPSPVDFGGVDVGDTRTQVVEFEVIGVRPGIPGVTEDYSFADFDLGGESPISLINDNCPVFPATRPIDQPCTVTLSFSPDALGEVSLSKAMVSAISIAGDSIGSSELTLAARGTGVTMDSDGDGVDDANDFCPNTPPGTEVDEFGCPVVPPEPDTSSLADLRADPRFAHLDGSGYSIVVLDSGIDLDHPAFGPDGDGNGVADRIVFTRDFTNEGDSTADDVWGSGTHGASIIGSGAAGYPGVAAGVNLIALQVLDNAGKGTGDSLERALQWVIDNQSAFNIVAVHIGLGTGQNSNVPICSFACDELAVLDALGIISVAPAGNRYFLYQAPGVDYPAAESSVIATGAVFDRDDGAVGWVGGSQAASTAKDRLLPISQRSETLTPIFAPGGITEGAGPGGGSFLSAGTGAAAAYVSGLAVLAQQLADEQLGRRLAPAEYLALLEFSADSIVDGDDEDDNVANTGASYLRTNPLALAEAIVAGGMPPPDPGDVPGDITTQTTLAIGACTENELELAGDTDWFRVELTQDTSYAFGQFGLTLEDPWLAVHAPDGTFLEANNDSAGTLDARLTFSAPSTDTYFLSAEAFANSGVGSYLLCAQPASPPLIDDIPADSSTDAELVIGQDFDSQIDFGGDEDWLRMELTGGIPYVITVVGNPDQGAPLADPLLEVYDASGTLVAVDDDDGPGLSPLLNFDPTVSGTYYANVRAYDADGFNPSAVGAYTARLELPGSAPFDIAQEAYLKASNTETGSFNDGFGWAVAADGDTVAVSAVYEDSSATGIGGDPTDNSAGDSGAVYVFTRSGNTWSQQAYIKASNTDAGDVFGISLDLDGDTLVVGATGERSNATGVDGDQTDNSAFSAGAVYVFTRAEGFWNQQAYLKGSNTQAGDDFGGSVAIDGDTLVVGATSEASNASGVNGNQDNNDLARSGAAYVFTRSGDTWSQQAYLKASDPDAFDFFGESVDVSGDTVIVGASGESSDATGINGDQADNSAPSAGAAYVFTRSGGEWTQQAYIKASNAESGDAFGVQVAIDGDTAVVGAEGEGSNASGINGDQSNNDKSASGAAYVFTRSGDSWSQQAYVKASNPDEFDEFSWFGLDIDGNRLVVTALYEGSNAQGIDGNQADNSADLAGAAYYYERRDSTWTQAAYIKGSNTEAFDEFGGAAALAGDTLIIGAEFEDSAATGVNGDQTDNSAERAGAAYVFRLTPSGAIGGEVSGLTGSGLVLRNRGGDVLAIDTNGPFRFPTELLSGAIYDVTVSNQPTDQTCTVSGGTGVVVTTEINDVIVTCELNRYSLGGTVSGLAGQGLVLRNNLGEELEVLGNGGFTFQNDLPNGFDYQVTISSEPAGQRCAVANGTGTIAGADVDDVTVTCADAFLVGGVVSGLGSGELVLQNNGRDDLSIAGDGAFAFARPLPDGQPFEVTVLNQPDARGCIVFDGVGTVQGADVTTVQVVCDTTTHSVGGTVEGLTAPGLVLRNNGGDDLVLSGNGAFTFDTELLSGRTYAVTLASNPAGVGCSVANGTGTIQGSDVTDVLVQCSSETYTVSGTVTGLDSSAPEFILALNNDEGLIVTNGPFTFATPLLTGNTYAVTVEDDPEGKTCLVSRARGIVLGMDVDDVLVECTPTGVAIAFGDACASDRASPALQEACEALYFASVDGRSGVDDALREITPEKATQGNIAVRQNNRVQNRNIGDRMVALRSGARGASFGGITRGPDSPAVGKEGTDAPGPRKGQTILDILTEILADIPQEELPVPASAVNGPVVRDGAFVFVGAPDGMIEPSAGPEPIQAALYEQTASGWEFRLALNSPDPFGGDRFASSIAIDGDLLLVGAPDDVDGGSVYAYRVQGGNVVDQARITNPWGAPGARFGEVLAVGNERFAVGAPGAWIDGVTSGAVTFYQQAAGVLDDTVELGTVVGSGAADGGRFGSAVATFGRTVAIGAPGEDGGALNAGAAYVFEISDTSIDETHRIVSPEAESGIEFGTSVGLSAFGFMFSAPGADDGTGRVYRYDRELERVSVIAPPDGFVEFGQTVVRVADFALIGAVRTDGMGQGAFLAVDVETFFSDGFE